MFKGDDMDKQISELEKEISELNLKIKQLENFVLDEASLIYDIGSIITKENKHKDDYGIGIGLRIAAISIMNELKKKFGVDYMDYVTRE